MLARCIGASCPRCGCQRTDAIGSATVLVGAAERRRCGHCAHVWVAALADPEREIAYDPKPARCHCPQCGAANPKVTRTMPRGDDSTVTRYHACDACGATFRSRQSG